MLITKNRFRKYTILVPLITGLIAAILVIIHVALHVFGFETCWFFECTTIAKDLALLLAFPGWIVLFITGLSVWFETTNSPLLFVFLVVPSIVFYSVLGFCIDYIMQKRL